MFAIPDMEQWQSLEIGPYTVTDISGLEPHTVYAVCVRAKSIDGRYGNFSEIVITDNLAQGLGQLFSCFRLLYYLFLFLTSIKQYAWIFTIKT